MFFCVLCFVFVVYLCFLCVFCFWVMVFLLLKKTKSLQKGVIWFLGFELEINGRVVDACCCC